MAGDPALDWLTEDRPTILVVVSSRRDLRRFVLSGAFEVLGRHRRLHYVLPSERAAALLSDAAGAVTPETASIVDVPHARVVEGTQPLDALVDLFDRYAPLYCIVPWSADGRLCEEVLSACKAEDVSCLLLQNEWTDFAEPRHLQRWEPFVACWGKQAHGQGRTVQQLERPQLAMVGAPQFDRLDRRRLDGATDGRRVILLVAPVTAEREVVLEQLARAAGEDAFGGASIVCHDPSAADDAETFRLIAACDALVAPPSSALLAGLILEKPAMALGFVGGIPQADAEVRASGALVWCEQPERLSADARRLLEPGDPDTANKARRLLINRVLTRQPGTYAERLAEFCRSSIENQARKQRARRTGAKRDTNSNSYGALLVARTYCGIADSAQVTVPGHWMHGWLPASHSLDPLLIAYHKQPGQGEGYDFQAHVEREREETPQWVSRADQAEYLRAHGYRHVKAIGLPIAYVPKTAAARIPGSLLVMPPHGHRTHGPDDLLAEAYADQIVAIADRFACIYLGVSEDDVAKQQWVESFRRRGIPVFTTADGGDPNTLPRLRRILSTFEYVTTNGFGSQIAFAAYCGAKVSVYGPFADFPRERIRSTHVVKMFPRFLDTIAYLCSEDALRAHYPFLFVEPDRAVIREDWGAQEVGAPSVVAPGELRRLFGWGAAGEVPDRFTASAAPARL